MFAIRQAQPEDATALYRICVETGDKGEDARHLYDDPDLIGHVYAAPYLALEPEFCFLVENTNGVCGYIVGTPDTRWFERQLEEKWWPPLRARYPLPDTNEKENWSADEQRQFMIHQPAPVPDKVTRYYPAHVHMNLLPIAQGQGMGARLLDEWLAHAATKGAEKVHVSVNAKNARATYFWQKCGFENIKEAVGLPPTRTIWLGREIS